MAEWVAIEIAELIECGLGFLGGPQDDRLGVEEKPKVFLDVSGATCRAGLLGLAMIARAGDPQTAVDRWIMASNGSPGRRLEIAAEILGISIALARMLELNHRNGVAAAAIARCLRAGSLGMNMNSGAKPAVPLRAAAA